MSWSCEKLANLLNTRLTTSPASRSWLACSAVDLSSCTLGEARSKNGHINTARNFQSHATSKSANSGTLQGIRRNWSRSLGQRSWRHVPGSHFSWPGKLKVCWRAHRLDVGQKGAIMTLVSFESVHPKIYKLRDELSTAAAQAWNFRCNC